MHKHSRASDSPQSSQSSQSSSDGVQSHFHFFVFTIQTHVIPETIPETIGARWKRLAEWHWEDLSQWPLPAPFDQTPGSWTCVSGRDDEDVRRNRQPLAPNDRERRPFRGRLGIEFTNSAVLTLFIILGAANSRFSSMDAVVCRLYSISAKPFRLISQSDLKEELFSFLEIEKKKSGFSYYLCGICNGGCDCKQSAIVQPVDQQSATAVANNRPPQTPGRRNSYFIFN